MCGNCYREPPSWPGAGVVRTRTDPVWRLVAGVSWPARLDPRAVGSEKIIAMLHLNKEEQNLVLLNHSLPLSWYVF